jgi:transcriptional regulator with XRE-family HTH domain
MVITANYSPDPIKAFCTAAGLNGFTSEHISASDIIAIIEQSVTITTHELVGSLGMGTQTLDQAFKTVGDAQLVADLVRAKCNVDAVIKPRLQDATKANEEKRKLIEIRERKWQRFLDASAPNPPTQVQILTFLRKASYKTQKELGEETDIAQSSIANWENETCPYEQTKLGELAKALTISPVETERFILLMRPDIIAAAPTLKDWLQETIKTEDWEGISFPSFRDKWLDAQPEHKRPGILLDDLMEQSGISMLAMDKKINVHKGTICEYKWAVCKINHSKLGELACALGKCSPQNILRLIIRTRADIVPEDPAEKAIVIKWLTERIIAKDKKAISFPALSSDALLDTQPKKNQAGLLLTDIIESRKVSRIKLYETVPVSQTSLSLWETGEFAITPSKLGSLIDGLGVKVKDAERLISRARPDLFPEDLAGQKIVKQWLHKKVGTKDWRNIWLPALEPDKEWLNAQPLRKHAGLLVHDWMEEKKESGNPTSQAALSRVLGVSAAQMSRWISGEKPIPPDKAEIIADRLIPCERREQFETAVILSNAAIAEFRTSMQNSTAVLGATTNANQLSLASFQGNDMGEQTKTTR